MRRTDLLKYGVFGYEFSAWKKRHIPAILFVLLFVFTGCGDPGGKDTKGTSADETDSANVQPDTPLMTQLRQEIAFCKREKILQSHTVSRYRNIMLSLPEKLSDGEKNLLEQYRGIYGNLKKSTLLHETELTLLHYGKIAAREQRLKTMKQKQQLFFIPKPTVASKGKRVEATLPQKKKVQLSSVQVNNKKMIDALRRDVTALHRQIYAVTSKRIIVSNEKEKGNHASEFARAVQLQEKWLMEKQKKYSAVTDKQIKKILAEEKAVLALLKDCRAVHEMTYNGGAKMKGVRLGRIRVVDTSWKGIEFIDLRDNFESRLKIPDLNYGVKMYLVAAGANRVGKKNVKFNGVPFLAYYHVLTGDGAISAASEMKLTADERQKLSVWCQAWDLPPEVQKILTVPGIERKD